MQEDLEEKTNTPKLKNDKGETITSRKGIANVSVKLYAEDQLGEEVQLGARMNTERESRIVDWKNENQSSQKRLPSIASKR